MTENQAIKIRSIFCNRIPQEELYTQLTEELAVELDNAIKKQIPKKLTHEATLPKCCTCPSCKNVVDEFETFWGQKIRVCVEFCKYCGQALDWGDSE